MTELERAELEAAIDRANRAQREKAEREEIDAAIDLANRAFQLVNDAQRVIAELATLQRDALLELDRAQAEVQRLLRGDA